MDSPNYLKPEVWNFIHELTSNTDLRTSQIINLARNYLFGTDVEVNLEISLGLFLLAAEKDNAYACFMVGKAFYTGNGVEKDKETGLDWIEKGALKGSRSAQFFLAEYYLKKKNKIYLDYAIFYLEKQVEKGLPEAQYKLGKVFFKLKETAGNFEKAVSLFELAAEQDHPSATHFLGVTFLDKGSINYDLDKAINLFEKAASLGNKNAQFKLLSIYSEIPKNETNTIRLNHWAEIARKQNENNIYYQNNTLKLHLYEKILFKFENKVPVLCKIISRIKSGFLVDVEGLYAFLPGSQANPKRHIADKTILEDTFEVFIVKINAIIHNIVVSETERISYQRQQSVTSLKETIKIGSILPGVVINIVNFGVFIDLGGLDGLAHESTLVPNWRDLFQLGQHVTVKVDYLDTSFKRISVIVINIHEDITEDIFPLKTNKQAKSSCP